MNFLTNGTSCVCPHYGSLEKLAVSFGVSVSINVMQSCVFQLGIYCFGLGMATIELTQGDKPGARLSEPLDSQRVQCEE